MKSYDYNKRSFNILMTGSHGQACPAAIVRGAAVHDPLRLNLGPADKPWGKFRGRAAEKRNFNILMTGPRGQDAGHDPRPAVADRGFSLIELIIFIIILGVLGSGFTLSFIISLQKIPEVSRVTAINSLLEERMTAIVGQKVFKGFSAVQDLCPGSSAICQDILGYPAQIANIQVTINDWEGDNHLKWITVKYLNEGDGLQAIVADY